MKKATNKIKTPSIHAMVFAAIIILMFFVFIHVETATYLGITERRDQNAEDLKWGTADIEEIQKGAEQCANDLEELSTKSTLAKTLVKNDEFWLGRVLNFLIVYGSRWIAAYCAVYIVWDGIRFVKIMSRKRGKYSKVNKEQDQFQENQ